jgi:hypothetical protein
MLLDFEILIIEKKSRINQFVINKWLDNQVKNTKIGTINQSRTNSISRGGPVGHAHP